MVNGTQNNIVSLALRLIQKKGYSSFSYDDIAKQLNITKAAIHYYYESKEDLGIAICKKIESGMMDLYEQNMERIKKNTGTPWDFIEGILAIIQQDENCPISSLQSSFEILSADFQEEIKKVSALQIELFLSLVKEYAPRINEIQVTNLFLSIKGALQYRRIMGESFFNLAIQAVNNQFNIIVSSTER